MIILCERNNRNSYLLKNNGFIWESMELAHNLNGKMYSLNLTYKIYLPVTYPKERSRKPIIELTQESLDQMLLLHSLGMSNQEIVEVIKGESDV